LLPPDLWEVTTAFLDKYRYLNDPLIDEGDQLAKKSK
jgi:hypothetical protein